MKRELYLAVLLLIVIINNITTIHAQPWIGDTWAYRQLVTIVNPGSTVLNDYQVRINLDSTFTFANANIDGSDIRITAADGVIALPFFIETWNVAGEQASIWVRVPSIPLAGLNVYLYYGNTAATALSNGISSFNAYDGFENYALGTVPTSTIVNPGEWERFAGNPLIAPGPTGSWDALGATFASVIYDDRVDEYRMYYHGYNSTYHQIGLATSPDGINWIKYSGNPIVPHGPSGSWDGTQTRVPMVWKEGITDYRMIYTGAGTTSGQVGYATSTDGINWTKYNANPVFNDPTWAHNQTENWGVMKVGNEYLMWYSTWGTRQSGIAVSTDLINWTPHTPGPIFATNSISSDDRYSQFCPFSFTYGGFYYVLVPSYSSAGDYSKFYLYRSSSPYFPESDRHLVRIAHTPQGVDAKDNDTPFILTSDIERSIFPNNELRVYYAGDPGSGNWFECLLIEPDIADALSDAPLPSAVGNLTWTPTGTVAVVNNPARQGIQSVRLTNTSSLSGTFTQLSQGVVGAWMRRSTTNLTNDFDIYLYDVTNTLNCVAGLGRDGFFHHWSGGFTSTGVSYSMDTWYFVTIEFNCTTNFYNFVVYSESMQEVIRRNGLSFGNIANSTAINKGMLYTGSGYTGTAIADGFRILKWAGSNIISSLGTIETNPLPVELSALSAVVIGSSVQLNWRTETEINNFGFEIERSETQDARIAKWEKVGFVNGNGNSNSPKDYIFTDNNLVPGKYSYRLKQIDNDGQFEYSKTIQIDFNSPKKFELTQNYPNPFNPVTTISFELPISGFVSLKVYDVLGNEVTTLVHENVEAGKHVINFDASNFTSGIYLYKIHSRSFVQTRKMILLK